MIKNFELYLAPKPSAATYVLKIDRSSIGTSGTINASNGTYYHGASKILAPSDFTAKRVIVAIKKTGTPAGSVRLWIVNSLSVNVPQPNTDAGSVGSDETVAAADLTTSYQEKTFNFTAGKALTGGLYYFVKLTATDIGNTSNYYTWERDTTGDGLGIWRSADDAAWVALASTDDANLKVYSYE